MIGSLRGTLLDRWGDGELLIEVAGVGYRVTVTPTTVVEVGELGAEVFVHIHHHLRDDAQVLYGFRTRAERECFESLLAAHGVGPAWPWPSCRSTVPTRWPWWWPTTTSTPCAWCRGWARRRRPACSSSSSPA